MSDTHDNSFLIDTGTVFEAKVLRERIHKKIFKCIGVPADEDHKLYLKHGESEDLVTDEMLIEICSNCDHPDRENLLFSKSKGKLESSTQSPSSIRRINSKSTPKSSNLKPVDSTKLKVDKLKVFFNDKKCIQVFDSSEKSFSIDISNISNDANAIRDRVYGKFMQLGSNQEYCLYLRAQKSRRNFG